MPLSVKWIFKGGVTNGWSEEFFLPSGLIAGIQNLINRFVVVRSAMLGQGATILGARVTDPDVPGAAGWYPVAGANVVINQPVDGAGAVLKQDVAQTSIILRLQDGTNRYRRMFELTGIPDDWVVWFPANGTFLILQQATNAINAFGNRLRSDGWAMHCISKEPAVVNRRNVQGVAYLNGVVTITSANHGYAAGDTIRINKVQGSAVQVAKGTYEITSVAQNTFTYNVNVVPIEPVVWLRGGRIYRQVKTYVPIEETQTIRVSSRKRGRQYFLQRGRRRAQ